MDKKNLILIVIIIVLLLIIVSGIILYVFVLNKPIEDPKIKEREINENVVEFIFPSFMNNIKDSKRIARVTIKLDIDKNLQELMTNRTAEIREAINLILRNKTEEDYRGSEGQLKLKSEVLAKIQEMLRTKKTIVVYVDEMIVQ
jgi:flagellar basal body-associated protein FliL